MLFVICYDIADDRRRRKLEKVLKDNAARVQESVFEAEWDEKRYLKVRDKVRRRIDEELDSVRFYRQCRACRSAVEVLGVGPAAREEKGILVV